MAEKCCKCGGRSHGAIGALCFCRRCVSALSGSDEFPPKAFRKPVDIQLTGCWSSFNSPLHKGSK
jgi:hypothetical protein